MDQVPESLKRVLKQAKDLLESGTKESSQEARELLLDNPDAGNIPLYHLMLARSAKECSEPEMGMMHLEKALELDPDNIVALLIIIESNLNKGKKDLANDLLQRACLLSSADVEQKVKLGQLLVKAGSTDQAVEYLRTAQLSSPNVASLRKAYANIHRLVGNDDIYESESYQSLETQDLVSSIQDRLELSAHYLKKRNYGKALGIASPLQSILNSITNHKQRSNVLLFLAFFYVKFDQKDRARSSLALLSTSDSIQANFVWSHLQLSEGDVENAYRSASAVQAKALIISDIFEKKAIMNKEAGSVNRQAQMQVEKIEDLLHSLRSTGMGFISQLNLSSDVDSIQDFLDASEIEVMTGSLKRMN